MNISKSTIEQILASKYKLVKALSLQKRYGGKISQVYLVIFSSPKMELIVKVYPDNFHWKMEKEVFLYDLIAKKIKIPTPKVIFYDDSKKILDKNVLFLSKVDGIRLNDTSHHLSKKQVYHVYFQMGTILRKIHSIKFDKFGYIGKKIINSHKSNYEYMTFQFNKKIAEFLKFGGDPKISRLISEFVTENCDLFKNRKSASLCHNDYHEGNVMIKFTKSSATVTGILDVENMLSGDPILDLAKTFYYSIKNDKNKEQGFLKGYGILSSDFNGRLELYQLYHALELWDWFALIKQRKHLKNIEQDILRIIGHLKK